VPDADFESAVWGRLAAGGLRRSYKRGDALLSEGDLTDRVLMVESGWVKLSIVSRDGQETVLGLRGPGQVIGELSVIDGRPRSANAIALEPVVAIVMPAPDVRRALEQDDALVRDLLRALAARLRDADRTRVELATLDTLARVARRLLELADRFGEATRDGGLEVALPLSQEEIASWCGASRESTAKALRTLRELGCVTTGRRTVTVVDHDALARHAAL
jgi:CRP/FNR family transcriptional regulator, cyclic AMP receptor protein